MRGLRGLRGAECIHTSEAAVWCGRRGFLTNAGGATPALVVYRGVSPSPFFRTGRHGLSFLQRPYRILASSKRNTPIVARPTIGLRCPCFMKRCLPSTGAARADSRWRGKRSISPCHMGVTGVPRVNSTAPWVALGCRWRNCLL